MITLKFVGYGSSIGIMLRVFSRFLSFRYTFTGSSTFARLLWFVFCLNIIYVCEYY
jgi:hypothetical protein